MYNAPRTMPQNLCHKNYAVAKTMLLRADLACLVSALLNLVSTLKNEINKIIKSAINMWKKNWYWNAKCNNLDWLSSSLEGVRVKLRCLENVIMEVVDSSLTDQNDK